MRFATLLIVCSFFMFEVALAQQNTHVGRRTRLPAALKEVSGMARLPNGDLWLLNDSNNPSDLFRLDPATCKVLEVRHLPMKNFDWEDLAHDSKGNLYIGDVGNNRNARKNLRIIIYNPSSGYLDSIQLAYPDQMAFPPEKGEDWNFNCEAVIFFQDSLHLFSKNSFNGDFVCKHYVLPAKPGQYIPELRESMVIKNRVITGAAISTDGTTLALVGYIIGKRWGFIPYTKASAMFFTDFKGSNFFKGNQRRKRLPKFLISRQFESIEEWKPGHWLIANEGRKPQFQSLWHIRRRG